jgi:hypothetical protein
MRIVAVAALCLSGLVASTICAEDKPKDKDITGAFKRKAGELDLKMVFKKDNLFEYHVAIGETSCVMTCKYTKDKDVYSFEVTNFEKKGDFPVNKDKGYKFSMKIVSGDKKVTVSDFSGDEVDDNAKQAINGDYTTAAD